MPVNRCYSGAEVINDIETIGSSYAERFERVGGGTGESEGTEEELKKLMDIGRAPMGLNPDQMRASARLVRAALDHGVSTFNEFVAFVVDKCDETVARQAAEGLELAWKTLKRFPEFSAIEPAGKVADVLGPEKDATDDGNTDHSAAPRDLSLVAVPVESGGAMSPKTGGTPAGRNANDLSGSGDGSLRDRTDVTAKQDPDGTRVAADRNDSLRQALRNYAKTVRKRAYMQARNMRTNQTTGKVADVLGLEKEVTDCDNNDARTTGRCETLLDMSGAGMPGESRGTQAPKAGVRAADGKTTKESGPPISDELARALAKRTTGAIRLGVKQFDAFIKILRADLDESVVNSLKPTLIRVWNTAREKYGLDEATDVGFDAGMTTGVDAEKVTEAHAAGLAITDEMARMIAGRIVGSVRAGMKQFEVVIKELRSNLADDIVTGLKLNLIRTWNSLKDKYDLDEATVIGFDAAMSDTVDVDIEQAAAAALSETPNRESAVGAPGAATPDPTTQTAQVLQQLQREQQRQKARVNPYRQMLEHRAAAKQPVQQPTAQPEPSARLYSTLNAFSAAARDDLSMLERLPVQTKTQAPNVAMAETIGNTKEGSDRIDALINELIVRPRAATLIENDLLNYRNDELSNKLNTSLRELIKAKKSGDDVQESIHKHQSALFRKQNQDLSELIQEQAGRDPKRFVHAQQAIINRDFTLERSALEFEAAFGREPNIKELATMQKQVDDLKASVDALEQLLADDEAKNDDLETRLTEAHNAAVEEVRQATTAQREKKEQTTLERLAKEGKAQVESGFKKLIALLGKTFSIERAIGDEEAKNNDLEVRLKEAHEKLVNKATKKPLAATEENTEASLLINSVVQNALDTLGYKPDEASLDFLARHPFLSGRIWRMLGDGGAANGVGKPVSGESEESCELLVHYVRDESFRNRFPCAGALMQYAVYLCDRSPDERFGCRHPKDELVADDIENV